MLSLQSRLMLGLLLAVLSLVAFLGTTVVSMPVGFLYRNAAGLSAARTTAQIAAGVAALGLLVTMFIVAVPTALQPASRARKLLYILPAYLLGLLLVGVLLFILGIGTTGPFAIAWTGLSALLSLIAVLIAAARMALGEGILKAALIALGITAAPSVVAWLGVVVTIAIVLTNQPSAGGFGSPTAPSGTPRPQVQGTPAVGAPQGQSPPGGAPRPQGTPVAGAPQGQGQPGFPPGPGGPGGGAFSTTPFLIGSGVMTLFVALATLIAVSGWRAARGLATAASTSSQPFSYRHEVSQTVFSGIGLTVAFLIIIQLIPIPRANPPIQTTVQWDSAQTKNLVDRACMDCHSNETQWPWYANVAPSSWLLASHVAGARNGINLSELDNIPSSRRSRLADDMAQRIRNGTMPPSDYLMMHPAARLSAAEKEQLIQGLRNSLNK